MAMPWPLPSEPQASHLFMPQYSKADLGDNDVAVLQILESRANQHPGEFSRIDLRPTVLDSLQNVYGQTLAWPNTWSDSLIGTSYAFVGPHAEDHPEEYGVISDAQDEEQFRTLWDADYNTLE